MFPSSSRKKERAKSTGIRAFKIACINNDHNLPPEKLKYWKINNTYSFHGHLARLKKYFPSIRYQSSYQTYCLKLLPGVTDTNPATKSHEIVTNCNIVSNSSAGATGTRWGNFQNMWFGKYWNSITYTCARVWLQTNDSRANLIHNLKYI